MTVRAPTWIAVAILLAWLGCREEDEARSLASLVAVHEGSADKAIQGARWADADVGDDFENGDRLRTSADGSARVRIVDSELDLGPSTLLSFGERIEVTGELRPAGGDVTLDLELGDVTLRRGSVVRIGDSRFEILVGAAEVERGGDSFALTAGDALVLEVGSAVVERAATAGEGEGDRDAGPAPPVGDLRVRVTGRPGTMQAPGSERREALRGDATLEPGTVVRLPRRSRARIERGGEALSVSGPVVVVAGAPGGALVAMRSGSATATATGRDVVVDLPGGRIVVGASPGDGSAAELSVGRRGARVAVRRGTARLEGDRSDPEALRHGEVATLDRRGGITVTGRVPRTVDAALRGDARVHAPTRTVDLRVDFSEACPGDGVVEVAGRRGFDPPKLESRGTGGANLRLTRGRSRYRVRCVRDGVVDDEVALAGTVRVDGELGTRQIAQVPPTSSVEADGRRYTILYQNRLPTITFSWPDAPEADGYELVLEREGGRARSSKTAEPRITLASGRLPEGEYQFRFASSRGASRSTRLRIDFDNAASSAYISSPAVRDTWEGDTVLIEGATLPGWRVRANGVALPVDRQQRFRSRIPTPENGRIGIEFVHPKRGRHIYVRRSADAS